MLKNLLKHKDVLFLIGILLLAAFLRLFLIGDYMTFLGDEGRDAIVLYNMAHGKLTLLGPTASVGGFYMGPIYYYLIFPFYLLFQHPVGPSIFVALLGVATVWLIYKVGTEFFNKTAGMVAASFYAVSPLAIIYARSSWNPNPMPFFTLLTLYVLYKAVAKNNGKLFLLVGFLFGLDIQLHYIETFVGVIIIFYTLLGTFLYNSRTCKENLFVYGKRGFNIFIGFLVGFSPFLAFEARHGFTNIQNIISFIFLSKDTGVSSSFLGNIATVFFRLFSRLLVDFPPYARIEELKNISDIFLYGFSILIAFVTTGVILLQYRKIVKTKDVKFLQYSLLILWFAIGILLFGFYKKPIYDYYFEFMFPLPFLFLGNMYVYLVNKKTVYKIIAYVLVVVLLLLCIQKSPILYPANKQVKQTETIARFVLDKTDGKPFNFALITGGNSDHAYRYFFMQWGAEPVAIENPGIDPDRNSVTDQLLVICDSLPCEPLGHSLWEVAGFGRAEIAGHWKVSVVEVYKLVPYKEK